MRAMIYHLLMAVCALVTASADVAPSTAGLDQEFSQHVLPLVKQFCFECHSTEKHKGDIDLEQFSTFDLALRHPKPWQQVVEQLSLGEMPPKQKPQPTAKEREGLLAWANQ